jgi:hypothetical protein
LLEVCIWVTFGSLTGADVKLNIQSGYVETMLLSDMPNKAL